MFGRRTVGGHGPKSQNLVNFHESEDDEIFPEDQPKSLETYLKVPSSQGSFGLKFQNIFFK